MRTTLLIALNGVLATADVVIALFFFKFQKRTGDRLFTLFALAFLLLAIQRGALTVAREWSEDAIWLYGIRLIAFLMIVYAIVDKNRAAASER